MNLDEWLKLRGFYHMHVAHVVVRSVRDNRGMIRIKFQWKGLPSWPVFISGEVFREGGVKKLPRGWGLHCTHYDRAKDQYTFKRRQAND